MEQVKLNSEAKLVMHQRMDGIPQRMKVEVIEAVRQTHECNKQN